MASLYPQPPATKSDLLNCNPLAILVILLFSPNYCFDPLNLFFDLVVYLVAFGDTTWNLSQHNFLISARQCSFGNFRATNSKKLDS